MKKMLASLMAVIMIIAMLPATAMATMPTVHPVVRTGVTRITFPTLAVVEIVSIRTGTDDPRVDGVSVYERLGIPARSRVTGEWNTITHFISKTSNFNIAANGRRIELTNNGENFIEHVQLVGTGAPGTENNPLHWSAIQDRVEEIYDGRGHVFTNADRNNRRTDVWVVVQGNRHGNVNYTNSLSRQTQNATLQRGEIRVIRMDGATMWAQEEPVIVTDFVFRTGESAVQADPSRYGWVWAPDVPIQFTVPSNNGIKVIQAFDPRCGDCTACTTDGFHSFAPGDTAYIGLDGATFWFHQPRQRAEWGPSFTRPLNWNA